MADLTIQTLPVQGFATVIAGEGLSEAEGLPATGATLLPTGPGQFLAVLPEGPLAVPALAADLAGQADVIDQSGSYLGCALQGADAWRALQKGAPVDLDPAVFAVGSVAVTVIAHIGAVIHRTGPQAYHVLVFRSFAGSFQHWLALTQASL